MNPADIAKELGRLATTHGLSKDVIDLMEKKIGLLTDEIISLTKERDLLSAKVNVLEAEKSDLTEKVINLEKKKDDFTPRPEGFDDTTDNVVKIMFQVADNISKEQIARKLGLELGIVQYHFDLLSRESMVRQTRIGMKGVYGNSPAAWQLASAGRAYAVKLKTSQQGAGFDAD